MIFKAPNSTPAATGSAYGGSALGNALRHIPLIGRVLGGAGDLVSGVVGTAAGIVSFGQSGTFGSGLSNIGHGFGGVAMGGLDLVGKAWNLPNTAIGVTAGMVGWALGGSAPTIRNNAIMFANSPIAFSGAITLGNSMLIGADRTNSGWGPEYPLPNGTVSEHEQQHTYQGQILGPLYLPANLLGGLMSIIRAPQGSSDPWHYNNFMETGPQSFPPKPW